MTKTTVKILADSLSPQGHRATSYLLKYWRGIHAECKTHRLLKFSDATISLNENCALMDDSNLARNSSSSRAETIKHKLQRVKDNMFIPDRFAKNCKGMSNKEWLSTEPVKPSVPTDFDKSPQNYAEDIWETSCSEMLESVKLLADLDVHKQHANRLIEPFEYIEVVVTATEYQGFFQQRAPKYVVAGKTYYSRKDVMKDAGLISCVNALGLNVLGEDLSEAENDIYNHLDWFKLNTNTAQPEMMELAEMMWDAMQESTPKQLKAGEWHLPDFSKLG